MIDGLDFDGAKAYKDSKVSCLNRSFDTFIALQPSIAHLCRNQHANDNEYLKHQPINTSIRIFI